MTRLSDAQIDVLQRLQTVERHDIDGTTRNSIFADMRPARALERRGLVRIEPFHLYGWIVRGGRRIWGITKKRRNEAFLTDRGRELVASGIFTDPIMKLSVPMRNMLLECYRYQLLMGNDCDGMLANSNVALALSGRGLVKINFEWIGGYRIHIDRYWTPQHHVDTTIKLTPPGKSLAEGILGYECEVGS